jgi:hypothetical protein
MVRPGTLTVDCVPLRTLGKLLATRTRRSPTGTAPVIEVSSGAPDLSGPIRGAGGPGSPGSRMTEGPPAPSRPDGVEGECGQDKNGAKAGPAFVIDDLRFPYFPYSYFHLNTVESISYTADGR